MATSSITANFEISGRQAAQAFVDGLWKAYRMKQPRRPKGLVAQSLTDPKEIRDFFAAKGNARSRMNGRNFTISTNSRLSLRREIYKKIWGFMP